MGPISVSWSAKSASRSQGLTHPHTHYTNTSTREVTHAQVVLGLLGVGEAAIGRRVLLRGVLMLLVYKID